jgi:hypothetical protein
VTDEDRVWVGKSPRFEDGYATREQAAAMNHGSNVIQFGPRRPLSDNTQCSRCGSEWFLATVCFVGTEVVGYGLPIICKDCTQEMTPS